jgi:hypothetical protein
LQAPPGFLSIIDIPNDTSLDDPGTWTIRTIDLANIEKVIMTCLYLDDPEPEYVAYNEKGVMALQENNCFLIFDLVSGDITKSFTGGAVSIVSIDATEDSCIEQTESLPEVLREPDGKITYLRTILYCSVCMYVCVSTVAIKRQTFAACVPCSLSHSFFLSHTHTHY